MLLFRIHEKCLLSSQLFEKKGKESTSAEQCYACNKIFMQKKSLERHLNVCGHMPGIIYKFENQNIQTFFDNRKFMGDPPFSTYFHFETTSGKKIYNFNEGSTHCLVWYAFVVAFHPDMNIEKIFVARSFNHAFEQLNELDIYLIKCFNILTQKWQGN